MATILAKQICQFASSAFAALHSQTGFAPAGIVCCCPCPATGLTLLSVVGQPAQRLKLKHLNKSLGELGLISDMWQCQRVLHADKHQVEYWHWEVWGQALSLLCISCELSQVTCKLKVFLAWTSFCYFAYFVNSPTRGIQEIMTKSRFQTLAQGTEVLFFELGHPFLWYRKTCPWIRENSGFAPSMMNI